jgi:hypothetical protein
MAAYRKKPIVIEAFRWKCNVKALCEWAAHADLSARLARGEKAPPSGNVDLPLHVITGSDVLEIDTLEGTMTAHRGDWIICGVKGEFYPCKPDIFEATYEPA